MLVVLNGVISIGIVPRDSLSPMPETRSSAIHQPSPDDIISSRPSKRPATAVGSLPAGVPTAGGIDRDSERFPQFPVS